MINETGATSLNILGILKSQCVSVQVTQTGKAGIVRRNDDTGSEDAEALWLTERIS